MGTHSQRAAVRMADAGYGIDTIVDVTQIDRFDAKILVIGG